MARTVAGRRSEASVAARRGAGRRHVRCSRSRLELLYGIRVALEAVVIADLNGTQRDSDAGVLHVCADDGPDVAATVLASDALAPDTDTFGIDVRWSENSNADRPISPHVTALHMIIVPASKEHVEKNSRNSACLGPGPSYQASHKTRWPNSRRPSSMLSSICCW